MKNLEYINHSVDILMEIQLRCDQMESINLKSITIRQNRLWQQTGDQADVDRMGYF